MTAYGKEYQTFYSVMVYDESGGFMLNLRFPNRDWAKANFPALREKSK